MTQMCYSELSRFGTLFKICGNAKRFIVKQRDTNQLFRGIK